LLVSKEPDSPIDFDGNERFVVVDDDAEEDDEDVEVVVLAAAISSIMMGRILASGVFTGSLSSIDIGDDAEPSPDRLDDVVAAAEEEDDTEEGCRDCCNRKR
jgi:hypothetical protein